jgi:glycerophosphoryl diester phosphodiesterase
MILAKNGHFFDVQGHRGARGLWPENTEAGVAEAARLGAGSVEIDVVLTADGVPVVFHDLTLTPDLVRGPDGAWVRPGIAMAGVTAAQLAGFDVGRLRPGSPMAARFPDQRAIDGARVPLLCDICALAARLGVRLDVEVKAAPSGDGPDRRVAAVLAAIGDPPPGTSLRSFDWMLLRRIRALAPSIPVAWLTASGADATPRAVAAEARYGGRPAWQPVWAPDHRRLRCADIVAAHQAGLLVKPWTVNAPARMRQLIAWGVDGLCTDRPDLGLAILDTVRTGR